jgi:hypothetical protein
MADLETIKQCSRVFKLIDACDTTAVGIAVALVSLNKA